MPNEIGMFDLYGNVYEHCWDFPFVKNDSPDSSVRYARGGSFDSSSNAIEKGQKILVFPYQRGAKVGFRICYRAVPIGDTRD